MTPALVDARLGNGVLAQYPREAVLEARALHEELHLPLEDALDVGLTPPDVGAVVRLEHPFRGHSPVAARMGLSGHRVRLHLAKVAELSLRVLAARSEWDRIQTIRVDISGARQKRTLAR